MVKTVLLDFGEKKNMSFLEGELYWTYMNELWQISGDHPYSRNRVTDWYLNILQNPDWCLVRIFDIGKTNGGEQIGFLVIGRYSECHEDADYFIDACYVIPEYRRKHVMECVFQLFAKDHPGRYCLLIIDNNEPAQSFWKKQFSDLHYVPFEIHEDRLEADNCHMHGFRPE